jgi:VWFA-related protein
MRKPGLTPALAFVAALAAAAQDAPSDAARTQATPVFEVGVDVVAVDVSVVDSQGRPLLGLRPEDFEIEVDGRPRVVASAEYLGRDIEPPRAAAPKPAHYSSNDDAAPGRLVLLLIDRGNIQRGNGRLAIAAADRFLGTLAPSDRVGLAVVPGPGPTLEFTLEHTQVRQALKHVVGQAERAGFQVPVSEALALVVSNDRLRWRQFVDLECGRFSIGSQLEQCIQQMESEAQQVYLNYRERSQQSKRALETVFLSLRGVPGPKTVVLVSEGLVTESAAETRRLAEIAAEAQVTLFVLLLDSSGVDAAYQKEQIATTEERDMETAALYDLASLARGAVLPAR